MLIPPLENRTGEIEKRSGISFFSRLSTTALCVVRWWSAWRSRSALPRLGVFLQLRRMSLMGDALSRTICPGVAVGYLLSGMSLLAMSIGGFIAGITVALVAGLW